MMLGMSQEKLGEHLGITFQQIQKYEKGTNRIGASRVFEISRVLGVPIQFFFDDFDVGAFLALERVEAGAQILYRVHGGDDDGDFGSGQSNCS